MMRILRMLVEATAVAWIPALAIAAILLPIVLAMHGVLLVVRWASSIF